MEPRCGKTKAVLDAIAIQAIKGRIKKVAVVCPLSALSVWEDEIAEHFPLSYRITNSDTRFKRGRRREDPKVFFFLINFDKWRQRSRHGKRWVYEWSHAIEEWMPDVVVDDESHRCKGPGTVTAQTLWRGVRRMRKERGDGQPFVYLMTGTPNPKTYRDIFAQYRIMDDSIFGTDVQSFEDRYCERGLGRRRFQIIKYHHKDELLSKIKEHAFVISRARAFPDAEPELPPVNIKIHLPAHARKLYDELTEEGIAFLEGGEAIEGLTPAVLRLRCQQITGGFTTKGIPIHGAKLKMAKDILVDLREQNEPCVVYCRFLAEVHAVRKAAATLGYSAYEITGAVGSSDRAYAYKRLKARRPPKPVCLVFQVATGSLAIDLSAAGEVIFYSLPDSFIDYWQAVSRVLGPKQTRAVRVRHLLAPGTVDVTQLNGLRNKFDLHAELMDNPHNYLRGVVRSK